MPGLQEKPWQDAMARVRGRVAEQVAMVLVERWWILGSKRCFSKGDPIGRLGLYIFPSY